MRQKLLFIYCNNTIHTLKNIKNKSTVLFTFKIILL